MRTIPRCRAAPTLLALGLLLVPALLEAQERPAAQACSATLAPAQVPSGNKAVRVTARLSQSIGTVQGIEAAGAQALKVAAPADLPRTELARQGETPAPIQMAMEENNWVLWLSTAEVEPGAHEFTLRGSSGECRARLTVTEG